VEREGRQEQERRGKKGGGGGVCFISLRGIDAPAFA